MFGENSDETLEDVEGIAPEYFHEPGFLLTATLDHGQQLPECQVHNSLLVLHDVSQF